MLSPIVAVVIGVLAGDACGDLKISSLEEFVLIIFFASFIWGFASDLKEKRERINWYTVYYPRTGKTKWIVWSVAWQKFWMVLMVSLFAVGFYSSFIKTDHFMSL
ncbi:hypothetical protein F3F96_04780 [Mariprofundus sp. NF]|nr:hypothetical protein [Mariprofundus sp. NF]